MTIKNEAEAKNQMMPLAVILHQLLNLGQKCTRKEGIQRFWDFSKEWVC